jgi:hypothetical protein
VAWLLGAALLAAACERASNPYAGISENWPTGSSAILATGLVAAFDMETNTGDGLVRDFSGHGHHGTVRRTDLTAGRFGQARVFTTVDDRIDLPETAAFDLDGPLTVATWVLVRSVGLHQHIFACDDKFALWVTPQNQFRLGDTQGNGFSTLPGSVESDTWYSVVAVLYATRGDSLTDENIEIWVNGAPTEGTADPTWSSTVLHPTDACDVGFESHQGNAARQRRPFVGIIDELLVFNRVLTPHEIRAHAYYLPLEQ